MSSLPSKYNCKPSFKCKKSRRPCLLLMGLVGMALFVSGCSQHLRQDESFSMIVGKDGGVRICSDVSTSSERTEDLQPFLLQLQDTFRENYNLEPFAVVILSKGSIDKTECRFYASVGQWVCDP